MHPSRRPRSPREAKVCCFGDPKAAFHIITVAVILGIVFFEDAIREVSMESQLLSSIPATDLGANLGDSQNDIGSARDSGKLPVVAGQNLAVPNQSAERVPNDRVPNDSKSFANRVGSEAIAGEGNDESVKRLDPEFKATGQSVTKNPDRQLPDRVESITADNLSSVSESASTSASGGTSKPSSEGRWINIDDFRKRAEERAMYDALQKRAAMYSQQEAEDNNQTSELLAETGVQMNSSSNTVKANTKNQEVKKFSEFRGVLPTEDNAELFKADNLTHLSFMIYRLVKTHNLTSLLDIPCTKSMFWMPEVLSRLEFEVPKFHYRCVTPDDEYLVEAILRFKDLTSAVVLKDPNFWASKLPQSDIALTWYGVGYLAPRQSWQLLKGIHQSKTKYVIIPNHPDVGSNPGSETRSGRVNVRRSPYRFDEALRVVNNISSVFPRKQLLMYELEGLRSDVL